MARTAVQEAIKEVSEQPDPSTQPVPTPPQDPDSTPSELNDRLHIARDTMKRKAKKFILGSIEDAIAEIESGDFGDVSEVLKTVEDFTNRVGAVPNSQRAIAKSPSSLFALPEGA